MFGYGLVSGSEWDGALVWKHSLAAGGPYRSVGKNGSGALGQVSLAASASWPGQLPCASGLPLKSHLNWEFEVLSWSSIFTGEASGVSLIKESHGHGYSPGHTPASFINGPWLFQLEARRSGQAPSKTQPPRTPCTGGAGYTRSGTGRNALYWGRKVDKSPTWWGACGHKKQPWVSGKSYGSWGEDPGRGQAGTEGPTEGGRAIFRLAAVLSGWHCDQPGV